MHRRTLLLPLLLLVGSSVAAQAAALPRSLVSPPRIDRIERFLTDQVTVHFDTEPGWTYMLQYRDVGGSASSEWRTLFTAPNLPVPNHYIVPDTRTSPARVYRLSVTP